MDEHRYENAGACCEPARCAYCPTQERCREQDTGNGWGILILLLVLYLLLSGGDDRGGGLLGGLF